MELVFADARVFRQDGRWYCLEGTSCHDSQLYTSSLWVGRLASLVEQKWFISFEIMYFNIQCSALLYPMIRKIANNLCLKEAELKKSKLKS